MRDPRASVCALFSSSYFHAVVREKDNFHTRILRWQVTLNRSRYIFWINNEMDGMGITMSTVLREWRLNAVSRPRELLIFRGGFWKYKHVDNINNGAVSIIRTTLNIGKYKGHIFSVKRFFFFFHQT